MRLGSECSLELECAATSKTLAAHPFIVLTLNLLNSRSSLVHLLLAFTLIHQSLDTCHLALSALRILTFSPFLGQRQFLVRTRSVLLRRPF